MLYELVTAEYLQPCRQNKSEISHNLSYAGGFSLLIK